LAYGETTDEILQEYEGLTRDDVLACTMFAGTPEQKQSAQ